MIHVEGKDDRMVANNLEPREKTTEWLLTTWNRTI